MTPQIAPVMIPSNAPSPGLPTISLLGNTSIALEGIERRVNAFYFDDRRMTETLLDMPARDDVELVEVLGAVADPVRLEILAALADKERPCGSFLLPVNDSTRSHHLKVLREAGLTKTRVVGTQRLVSLRRDDLDARFPGLLDAVLAAAEPAVSVAT
jgi:DNA-binding transcriptional ArsR family regulator